MSPGEGEQSGHDNKDYSHSLLSSLPLVGVRSCGFTQSRKGDNCITESTLQIKEKEGKLDKGRNANIIN